MGMDFNMAFAILNIEMTKDESLIRSAYRMALPANHPEDNPEGFQLLREAYEKALAYSRIFNHDPEPEDNTPIGVLRKKLAGIYQSISARTCYESWKELLWEDVFDDLDSYEEAKWELFTFLQGNYRIPREIYQLLNERFDVCENVQEFREKLSAAFVDYMVSNVSNENCGYSYEWFRMLDGRDDADYDSFLDYVQELEEALHNEDMTRAERLIRMIDAMGIRYPYYTLDKADYFIAIGKKEEAKAIALELADMETYRNDAPIQMRCGEVLWRVGEKQKAYVSLCQSLVLDDENYIGNKYAALYEMEHGELKNALHHIYAAEMLREDEEVNKAVIGLERQFIALCGKDAETLEAEDARLLGYAYRYQGELDKAIAVIKSKASYETEIKDYHMLIFYLYKQKEDYTLAFKYGKRRLECVKEKLAELEAGALVSKNDTKESLMRSLCDSNLQLGLVLMVRAKNAWLRKERVKWYQEAIPFLTSAWDEAPENIIAQMNLAYCYLEIREFQKTYTMYDALISRLGEQSGLLILKQKLCYEMGKAQEVVGLYYQMLYQGARDAGIYEYAARVYLDEERFDDAKNILAKADSDGVTSYGLRALNLICRFLSSKTNNGFALDVNQELDEMLQEGARDAQNFNTQDYLAELYYIKALSAAQVQQNEKQYLLSATELHDAKELYAAQVQQNKRQYLLSAIKNNDREKYHNALASLYIQTGQHQEALNEYSYIEENFTPDAELYIKMAVRYFTIHDIARARAYARRVIDFDPENEDVYRAAAMIYDDFGSDRGIFFHDSIRLWKQYIAYNPEKIAFAYVRCGMAHLQLGQYQEALYCFTESEKTAQWDCRYDICVLFGRTYAGLGRYEEAASYMEQGLGMLKEKEKSDEYACQAMFSLVHIYVKLGKIDAADKTIRDYMEYYSFNKKAFAIIVLKDVYVSAGLYEKAENLLRFYTYVERIIEEGFYTYMTLSARHRLCTSYWKKKLLFWEVKKALRAYDRDDLRRLYADMLAYDFLMVKESVSVRQKMQRTLPVIVWDEHRDDLLDLIRLNKFLQKDDETARYKKVALDALQRRFGCGDLDIYNSCIDSSSAWRLDNLTYLVQLFSLTGEVALAEKYVVMMGECALCTDCNETICYDRFEAFGVFYEAKGDMQRAYEYYEKAVKSHGYYKGYAMLCMKRKYGKKWRKEGKTDLANNMC